MFWTGLDHLSDILQVLNFMLLLQDSTNNELMKHLQEQDNVLNEQTDVYLKGINKKLDMILGRRIGMEDYEELVEKIVKKEKGGDMHEYKEVMEELMYELESRDRELYDKTVKKLEEVAYDITHEEAEKIVRNMKPYGEHWTFDQVKEYIEGKGIGKCHKKYYMVMNMMYNDYYNVAVKYGHQDDADFFFCLADAFINDEDAKPHKVAKYFLD